MITQKNKNLINHLLIGGLIFVIPSNLFLVITEWGSYVKGLKIDYLLPKIFLSDLILLALSLWLIFSHQINLRSTFMLLKKKWSWIITICLTWLIVSQLISAHPLAAAWQSFKIIETIWIVYLLNQIWPKIKTNLVITSTSLALIFQSGLATLQFINQRSIASYWLLGEPNLNNHIGLAKQVFLGQNRILPYGTTAHPNVLAGFIVVIFLLLVLSTHKYKLNNTNRILLLISTFIALMALWLTQSWSAFATLILGLVFWKIKPSTTLLIHFIVATAIAAFFIFSFIGPTSKNPSLFRRYYLNHSAIKMVENSPLTGVGINNFVGQVENFSPTREVVRFVQPAHHTFLLIISEFGLLGIIAALTIATKILNQQWKKSLLLATATLVPILVLDHYLYTLQTGLLLFGVLVIALKNSSTQLQK